MFIFSQGCLRRLGFVRGQKTSKTIRSTEGGRKEEANSTKNYKGWLHVSDYAMQYTNNGIWYDAIQLYLKHCSSKVLKWTWPCDGTSVALTNCEWRSLLSYCLGWDPNPYCTPYSVHAMRFNQSATVPHWVKECLKEALQLERSSFCLQNGSFVLLCWDADRSEFE